MLRPHPHDAALDCRGSADRFLITSVAIGEMRWGIKIALGQNAVKAKEQWACPENVLAPCGVLEWMLPLPTMRRSSRTERQAPELKTPGCVGHPGVELPHPFTVETRQTCQMDSVTRHRVAPSPETLGGQSMRLAADHPSRG